MKISIIIPTLNSSSVLRRALDSIVCQTFTDWEVMVMDGVSQDDTVLIAKSYYDSRIKVFSEPDKGLYDAMNKGIAKAKGEWLYFLGSDDYLFDRDVLSNVFAKNYDGVDVIYGEVEACHLSSFCHGEWTLENIGYNRCHQAIFYRKSLFDKLGHYDLKYPIAADHVFNMKWMLNDIIQSRHVDLVIAHFSTNGISSVAVQDSAFLEDWGLLLYRYGKQILSAQQLKEGIRYSISYSKGIKLKLQLYLILYKLIWFAR